MNLVFLFISLLRIPYLMHTGCSATRLPTLYMCQSFRLELSHQMLPPTPQPPLQATGNEGHNTFRHTLNIYLHCYFHEGQKYVLYTSDYLTSSQ